MSTIGNLIKRRRMALGMTKAQLARACGVSKNSIGLWESGATAPNRNRIAQVEAVLGPLGSTDPRYIGSERKQPTMIAKLYNTHGAAPPALATIKAASIEELRKQIAAQWLDTLDEGDTIRIFYADEPDVE